MQPGGPRPDPSALPAGGGSTSRRALLAGAGAVGVGALAAAAQTAAAQPAPTAARPVGAQPAPIREQRMPTAAQPTPAVWYAEYAAIKQRGDLRIRLQMYRKRLGPPALGEAARPVLFLVHGSSPAALSSFDLDVSGHGDYSLMDAFARLGFDVWTMDHEGYGRSDRTDGNSDIASGVQDLIAAMPVVQRETGQARVHMLGESSGALRAGAFAMAQPERMNRLVLEAFTYTGEGSPTLGKRAERAEFYRTHNRRPRDKAMLLSIFTRDRPGTTDPAVAEAFAEKEMQYGDSVPTGTYLDMVAHLPVVEPARVLCPVLVIKGEFDGISALPDLESFLNKLPNGDRQLSVIAGAAHAIGMSHNRRAFWHVVNAFLTVPDATA